MLKLVSVSALVFALASAPGVAAGGELPRAISIGDERLHLNGAGTYEATLFNVDVFEAGLYLARPTANAAKILTSDELRCLVLRFERAVSRQKLVEVARDALGRARGPRFASQLERLLGGLPDAEDGDLLTFTQRPRGGLDVTHNGRTVARADDAELARAFFASWIGPRALSDDLSRSLLGR